MDFEVNCSMSNVVQADLSQARDQSWVEVWTVFRYEVVDVAGSSVPLIGLLMVV